MMAVKVGRVTLAVAPWDLGPLTAAQIAGKRIEEVTEIDEKTGKRVNPNGVIRTRRETWVGRYLRQGKLSVEQANIADYLFACSQGHRARDPLAAIVRVDHEGRRDPVVDRVESRRTFLAMWGDVPAFAKPVIDHVVLNDQSLRTMPGCSSGVSEARHLYRLQRGLDALSGVGRK